MWPWAHWTGMVTQPLWFWTFFRDRLCSMKRQSSRHLIWHQSLKVWAHQQRISGRCSPRSLLGFELSPKKPTACPHSRFPWCSIPLLVDLYYIYKTTCTTYIKLVACEWWSCSLVWLLQITLSELLKETSVFGAEDLKLKNTFWLKLWALLNTNQPTYLGTTGDLLRLFRCYIMVRMTYPGYLRPFSSRKFLNFGIVALSLLFGN